MLEVDADVDGEGTIEEEGGSGEKEKRRCSSLTEKRLRDFWVEGGLGDVGRSSC